MFQMTIRLSNQQEPTERIWRTWISCLFLQTCRNAVKQATWKNEGVSVASDINTQPEGFVIHKVYVTGCSTVG